MHVLIILAHPRLDSFNAAIAKTLMDGLSDSGHTSDLADLYAEGFQPALTAEELIDLGHSLPPADVSAYQKRILESQGLAFIFPVWWFGPPAMLKGFVDRVLLENFAYKFKSSGMVKGLLRHRKALVINTAGASASLYKLFRFGKPLEKTFDDWMLKMCGIGTVKHVLFHDVVVTDDETREDYLAQVGRIGREYF